MPAERRIVVCADDFGLHAGVDEAVLALAQAGRVSAVSCMTGCPHWGVGAARLRALDPDQLDVGLHLDLTEQPFDAALRRPLPAWLACSYLRLWPRAALRAEIERQFDAFEAALGRPPDHVDGHQHVHQLPGVRDALLAHLAARYPRRRLWLRSTRAPAGEGLGKARLIAALGSRTMERAAAALGFARNGHLLGAYDFRADAARYLALLEGWLAACVSGDLLMCHPAAGTDPADRVMAPRRVVEYGVLSGPQFAASLARHQVRPVPFSRL